MQDDAFFKVANVRDCTVVDSRYRGHQSVIESGVAQDHIKAFVETGQGRGGGGGGWGGGTVEVTWRYITTSAQDHIF